MMFKKVAFTMYKVNDMARARTFYEQTLGLPLGTVYGDHKWVEYDLPGGGCLAITTMAENVTPSATAGGSIAFEVEDLSSLVKDLRNKNVKFIFDIFESPVCWMAIIMDSEGNAVTLHQVKARK